MKKILFTVCALLCISFSSVSQVTKVCGTDMLKQLLFEQDSINHPIKELGFNENLQRWRSNHPGMNHLPNPTQNLTGHGSCTKANYVIPVVVHVIHSLNDNVIGSGTNISVAQIEDQIEILNKAYANIGLAASPAVNTGIQFCLAQKMPDGTAFNGITRTSSTTTQQTWPTSNTVLRNLIEYDPEQYLNIYVVEDINVSGLPSGAVLAGYANFPWDKNNGQDGVVIDYNFFGDYTQYGSPLNNTSLGKTLVHEVGHYLGLYHPFEGGCAGLNASDCSTKGDKCCDVPAVITDNSICPNPSENTCIELYNSNPADQKQNYMDYSPENCVTTFTADQTDLLYTTLSSYRSTLVSPQNVNSKDLSCCINAAFFTGNNFVCYGEGAEFICYEYNVVDYQWNFYKDNTLEHTSTTSSPSYTYTATVAGTYDVELNIIESGNTLISKRVNDYLTVQDCGSSVASTRGNWYFGQYAGIRFYENGVFRDDGPILRKIAFPLEAQISSKEGTISASSEHGELLFYGGEGSSFGSPYQLFDKSYQQISEDTIWNTPLSASQGVIALPTQDSNVYTLITVSASDTNGIKFSLQSHKIDVSIVNGSVQGKVIEANKEILDSLGNVYEHINESMGATYASDTSFWLIVQDFGIGRAQQFLVTDDTIVFHKSFPIITHPHSQVNFSPNGRYLNLDERIYSFDPKTGESSLLLSIDLVANVYGACFSSNSEVLYLNERQANYPGSQAKYRIVQYDLGSSETEFGKQVVGEHYGGRRSMELGPDNKIYVANSGQTTLPRINNPNNLDYGGNECGLLDNQVVLSENGVGGLSQSGLPNFLDGLKPDSVKIDFVYRISNCNEVQFLSNNAFGNNYSWTFGDGTSSSDKDPVHTYSKGSYSVTLTQDGVTVQKDIDIKIPDLDLQMVGASNYCDTTQAYEYSVEDRPNFDYQWSTSGSNPISVLENKAFVIWKTNGSISAYVSDKRTGCKDTASLSVYQSNLISNISINPVNQYVCDSNSATQITGDLPTGGDGNFLYQWYESTSGTGDFTPIIGATSKDFTPTGVNLISRFYREVTSNNCKVGSDTAQVTEYSYQNSISLANDYCLPGTAVELDGNDLVSISGTSYTWQYSTDSISWLTAGTAEDLTRIQSEAMVYYRRIATWQPVLLGSPCTTTSNVVAVVPSIQIIEQPTDEFVCNNASTHWTATIEVENPQNITINYVFQYKRRNTLVWLNGSSNSDSVTHVYGYPDVAGTASNLDSFRFIIQTPCGDITSEIGVLRDISSTPSITAHPTFKNTTIGTPAQYNAYAILNDLDDMVFWQKQLEGTTEWITLENSDTFDFDYSPVDICDDKSRFRMGAQNSCGISYTNSALLNLIDSSDIWMRDSHKDTGAEPNEFSEFYDIVRSPDMWNRKTDDNGTVHEDMEFKNNSPNELYIKVRNRGTRTTVSTPLYLYWTLGQINNEEWHIRWLDEPNNQFYNADSAKDFPMGSRINEQNDPIMVPPIAPGDSIVVSYSWYPPNPAWYYRKDANGNKVGDFGDRLSVCVVARLEHCETYPHKMKINEIFNQHVKVNAVNNNNIITKNMWVVDENSSDLVDQDDDGDIDWIGGSWTGIGRQQSPSTDIRPCFSALSDSFFAHWNVAIEVEDVVRDAILNSSASNTNVIYLGDNIFTFGDGTYRCIDQIALPDEDLYFFRPLFSPVIDWASLPNEVFEVGVAQYNSIDEVDGAGSFVLDNSNGELDDIQYAVTDSFYTETNHLLLSPNPTNAQFTVQLDQETKDLLVGETGSVIVADGYGYPHIVLHNISSQDVTTINLHGYKAGVYNVRFEIDGHVYYKYVVKTDQ